MRRWLMVVGVAALVGAVLELVVIGVLISWIGVAWTLGLLVAKGVVGYLLARRVGRRGWRQFRASLDSGRPPGREVTDAVVALAGAMLVMLAGFIGAVLGVAVLLPPVRRAAAGLAERLVEGRVSAAVAGDFFGPRRVAVQREHGSRPGTDRSGAGARSPGPGAGSAPRQPDGTGDDGPAPAIEGEVLPPADRR